MNWLSDVNAPTRFGVTRGELEVHLVGGVVSGLITFALITVILRGKISNAAI